VVGTNESTADTSASAPSARERQEWVHLRVTRLEELARRNAWLVQRREAVARLGSMLSEHLDQEPMDASSLSATKSPAPRSSTNGRSIGNDSTEIKGASCRA
jgi:hypothetical protein